MGYYRGDYYRGDYYRGDPGFLSGVFNVVKGVVGTVAKIGGSLLPGPAGAVLKGVGGAISPTRSQAVTVTGSKGGVATVPGMQIVPVPGITGAGQRLIPGGATGYMIQRSRRRMNVTNVKALRRAGRRVKGFLKLARRMGALPVNTSKGRRLYKTVRRTRK